MTNHHGKRIIMERRVQYSLACLLNKHTRIHTHSHSHAFTCTHTLTLTHASMHSHTHTHTHSHSHMHSLSLTLTPVMFVSRCWLPPAGHRNRTTKMQANPHPWTAVTLEDTDGLGGSWVWMPPATQRDSGWIANFFTFFFGRENIHVSLRNFKNNLEKIF